MTAPPQLSRISLHELTLYGVTEIGTSGLSEVDMQTSPSWTTLARLPERLAGMGMTVRFEIFPSDLDTTVDFYTRVLGFDIASDRRDGPEPYVAFRRDDVHIGALRDPGEVHRHERHPPVGVEVVLEVDDVEDELERVRAGGWDIAEGLGERPWGLRDFRVLDPSGYYLRITNRTASL